MRWIHIVAGLFALASGAVAFFAAKGSPLHRASGRVFGIAMLVMTTSAMISAGLLRPNRVNATAGLVTFYLVCTGWLAVARTVEQAKGRITGLMLIGFSGSAYALSLALETSGSDKGLVDGIPAAPLVMFGLVALLGGLGDLSTLRAGGVHGARRLVRHLWRMGFAMWIAAASFFLGQARLFPEPIRNSGLLALPVVLVLLMLVYWLVRVQWLRRRGTALPVRSGAPASEPQAR